MDSSAEVLGISAMSEGYGFVWYDKIVIACCFGHCSRKGVTGRLLEAE